MKQFLFLTFLSLSFSAFAQMPEFRPVGKYSYTNEVLLTKKRTAETVGHLTPVGMERIRELKKDGFMCVRKNQKDSICQKTENNLETPEFIQAAIDNYLEKAKFTFTGTAEPEIFHDGSSTEWLVNEVVMLGNKKVNMFKIVRTSDNRWFVSFPVTAEQGIGNMEIFSNEKLGLPLTLQGSDKAQTIAYFITAVFTK